MIKQLQIYSKAWLRVMSQLLTQKKYRFITVIAAMSVLLFYAFIFSKTTTWTRFWQSNIPLYNWLQIGLSIVNALLIGLAISLYLFSIQKKKRVKSTTFIGTVSSLIFSAAATGCPVCGAYLLPIVGIATSLTALPLGGLEIKALSAIVLLYFMNESVNTTAGICPVSKNKLISIKNRYLELSLTKKTIPQLVSLSVIIFFIAIVYALPWLPKQTKLSFTKPQLSTTASLNSPNNQTAAQSIFNQINPRQGYAIPVQYSDIGPQMIDMGVIDLDKFKKVYQQSNQPLTQEQLDILTKGSNKKITITPENSYFLLNFFWAFGLANQSKVLDQGEMVQYGKAQVGNFASTGGWSLGKTDPMSYYSGKAIVPLTPQQEDLVNSVASNIYRPCCGNSTAFPDCNHGMALLGLLELMGAQGANENQMYDTAKYVNAFWFPGDYYEIALYFKHKEGKDYKDIGAKTILGKEYSSVFGAQAVKKWLTSKGLEQPPPQTGGGCGV